MEKGAYFLVKLYDHFPPAQRDVCKTTMYSNNFNTITSKRFEMFNYISISELYICFKMFMTCMMRYVILAKMKTN